MALAVVAACAAAVACAPVDEVDELQAVPLIEASGPGVPDALDADDPAVAEEEAATPAPDDAPPLPGDRDVADFLAEVAGDAAQRDHLRLAVWDEDPARALVVVRRDADALAVLLARWQGERFVAVSDLSGISAHRLGIPVARDVTQDGAMELVLPYVRGGSPHVSVVAITSHGRLTLPSQCPVPDQQRQVLRFDGAEVSTALLGCEAGDLVWDGRAFLPGPAPD